MARNIRRLYVLKISTCTVIIVFAFVFTLGFIDSSVAEEAGGSAKYPSRPIKIMVPAAAGGSIGIEIRVLTPLLEKHLGASIIV